MDYIVIYSNVEIGHNSDVLCYKSDKGSDRLVMMTFSSVQKAESEVSERTDLPPGTLYNITGIPDPFEFKDIARNKTGVKVLLTYINSDSVHHGIGQYDTELTDFKEIVKEVKARRSSRTLPASLDFNYQKLGIIIRTEGARKNEVTYIPSVEVLDD